MIIKRIQYIIPLLLIVSGLCVNSLKGQLAEQNSLYLIDLYQINKGYGGLDKSLSVNFNFRDQWTGIDQQPNQIYINAHMPLYLWDGGVGFSLKSDRIGALRINSFDFSYNRIVKRGFGVVSGGLALGFSQSTLDGQLLVTPEGIYQGPNIDHRDPILLEGSESGFSPDYNLSFFLGHQFFDLGISVSNFLFPDTKIANGRINNGRNLSIFGRFPIVVNELLVYPSMLIKTDFSNYQTDISALVKSGNIFGGLSLRGYNESSLDALVIIGGVKINRHYTLSYSFDYGLSDLNRVSQGSHEINLNYNLNKLIGIGLLPEIIYNPRNL